MNAETKLLSILTVQDGYQHMPLREDLSPEDVWELINAVEVAAAATGWTPRRERLVRALSAVIRPETD